MLIKVLGAQKRQTQTVLQKNPTVPLDGRMSGSSWRLRAHRVLAEGKRGFFFLLDDMLSKDRIVWCILLKTIKNEQHETHEPSFVRTISPIQ